MDSGVRYWTVDLNLFARAWTLCHRKKDWHEGDSVLHGVWSTVVEQKTWRA